MPHYIFEARVLKARPGPIAGIDEAGRGPLAGPVVAAAVILDRDRIPKRLRERLDDTKKLSAAAREEYAALLRGPWAVIGVGAASVAEIDRHNILRATLIAMARAVSAMSL